MKTLYALDERFFALSDMHDYGRPQTAESDKQCLLYAMRQFLAGGKKEDAFSVYFCFSEIFSLFGRGYENMRTLLELLSDHEYHSGELLSKHRDHYSHSVYVFALGLAFYANDPVFRRTYLDFYGLQDNGRAAFHFLRLWGMTALFHDIGYPFQLAHEQIKTYAEEVWGKGNADSLFVSYGNFEEFITIGEGARERLRAAFSADLSTYNDLLAYGLQVREGYPRERVAPLLTERVIRQPNFMDHGYFSAVILARQMCSMEDFTPDMEQLDVLTAILLHNSFNKYDAPDRHPISLYEHPLSYLLILCDELQCWDRLAYGKISKRDPIAWDFSLDISENALSVCYTYDSYIARTYNDALQPDVCLNKNYREMRDGVFVEKLKGYIQTPLRITVRTQEKPKQKKTRLFASDDSFVSLCDLAKAIHASYNEHCSALSGEFISREFGDLALEFKLSNIEQAKSYADKLERINCFFSRKDLDYPVVEDFHRVETPYKDNLGFLCREEHVRWVREKLAMGWTYGIDYTDNETRDRKKHHRDLVPYDLLDEEERSKDELMVNNILTLLKKFDSSIRIYNYRTGGRPQLEIAGTGHRFYSDDPETLKARIKDILGEYAREYQVTVRTCFAYGADQLIAECAAELGLTLKAILPMPMEAYIQNVREDALSHGRPFTEQDEQRMRELLAQTVVCRVIEDPKFTYAEASRYMVSRCDKLLALWDGRELPLEDDGRPINRGGTYDCIRLAEAQKKEIIRIDCYR